MSHKMSVVALLAAVISVVLLIILISSQPDGQQTEPSRTQAVPRAVPTSTEEVSPLPMPRIIQGPAEVGITPEAMEVEVGKPVSLDISAASIAQANVYRHTDEDNEHVDLGDRIMVRIIPTPGAVAWFDFDMFDLTTPGEEGVSVLAAHVNDIFSNLNAVSTGDDVIVTDEHGNQLIYRISSEPIQLDKLPEGSSPDVFTYIHDHSPHPSTLWLITCVVGERHSDGPLAGHATMNDLVRAELIDVVSTTG